MEKPVIFLAAGPSLTKNIDWLKENKDKFIIATAAINLSILEKYDIFPNMIFSIDGGKNTLNEYVFDKLENKEYKDKIYKESIFILSSVTDIDSLKNISKDNIFIYQVKTKYNKNLSAISGFSIGETAYGLLLIMGVKKLFLLGLDLAIDSDTGKTHSENTLSASSFDIDVDGNSLENSQNSSVYESVVSVKGNLREKVHSTILFNQSRIVLNLGTNLYKQDFQEVYNLSDGAYFENTKPLQKDNILDVIDLKNISTKQEEIKEEFLKESENTLPKDDLEYLHKCYEEIENIETKIKNFAKIKGFSNKGSYLDVLYDFILDLIYKNEKEFSYFPLYDLYKDYFKFIIPRIFTFFSIKDVKNHKRHTKKIHSYLIKQLFKINDKYKCDMREFLDSL